MNDEQRQRLERMRQQKASRPTDEDYVALVEACCEQDMATGEIIMEIRRLDGCGLREALDRLRYYARQTEHSQVAARRASFDAIGRAVS